jgi:hypothetical protein
MKIIRQALCLLLAGLLLAAAGPAAAAPFDPSVLRVEVDDSLWQSYHLGPEPASGDTVTLHRIKKAEVAVLAGGREFAVHTFTPQETKPHKFSIPHGVTNLKLRLRTWTADDLVWTKVAELKEAGDNIVIKAVPAGLTGGTPGF